MNANTTHTSNCGLQGSGLDKSCTCHVDNGNEVTYVAVQMDKTESGNPYTPSARVFVNDQWRFAIQPRSPYDPNYVSITMLTRVVDGHWQATSFLAYTHGGMIHETITELAQLLPPF